MGRGGGKGGTPRAGREISALRLSEQARADVTVQVGPKALASTLPRRFRVDGRLSSKCNRKELRRGTPVKTPAMLLVNESDGVVEVFLGKREEIIAFGEEKTQEIICILVGGALPGLVRLGEIDKSVQLLLHVVKGRKFRFVVKADTADGKATQERNDRILRFLGGTGTDDSGAQEAGLPVHQRDQTALADCTVNGIPFPVAEAGTGTDFLRPLWNDAVRVDGIGPGLLGNLAFSVAFEALFCSVALLTGNKASEADSPPGFLRRVREALCWSPRR